MPALISSVTAVALAAALSGSGTAAPAAGPAPHPPPPPAHQAPVFRHQAPPPHWFRARFDTQAQCQARAGRDHPGRPGDWDCRRGPDRAHPWEYWGR